MRGPWPARGMTRVIRRFAVTAAAGMLVSAVVTGSAGVAAASPSAHGKPPVPGHPMVMHMSGAARPKAIAASGTGDVTAHRSVSLRMLARQWRAAPHAAGRAVTHVLARGALAGSQTVPAITANFDGIRSTSQLNAVPVAATNGHQIVQTLQDDVQVFDYSGATLCGGAVSLTHFLRTSDPLLPDPKVQYDNTAGRFSVAVGVLTQNPSSSTPPALYLAASASSDPCGTWNVYRINFTGPPFDGSNLTLRPVMGQDSQALLFGISICCAGNTLAYMAFAIPKDPVYTGGPGHTFPTFPASDRVIPASSAGQPIIVSQSSYFVAIGPNDTYDLYTMADSGSASPSFAGPQTWPGRPGEFDIFSSPVYDGARIWFSYGARIDDGAFEAVYGFIDPSAGTIQTALARHDAESFDADASIGVGLPAHGPEMVFLNWAYEANGGPWSDTVASFSYAGGSLPSGTGIDQTLITGSPRVGFSPDIDVSSSVSIEPSTGSGTCAVTAQGYLTDGAWVTRLARVCATAAVPGLAGQIPDQAKATLEGTGLARGAITSSTSCDPGSAGTVVGSSPAAGTVLLTGSLVDLTECVAPARAIVPPVIGDSQQQASDALAAAGFAVGSVQTQVDNSCDFLGTVMSQTPAGGTEASQGTAVSLVIGKAPRHCDL